jgi:ectoine hydroxylase-related dioxygenase (phytanoyl-CoA dioxygenase family)
MIFPSPFFFFFYLFSFLQVWAKPPGASPLVFHRDSAYFDFEPFNQVVTVWVALDDMTDQQV